MEDFEFHYRYYNRKDVLANLRPHFCTFRVWAESMSLRYFIEFGMFTCIVIAFQILISDFNQSMHSLDADIANMIALNAREM